MTWYDDLMKDAERCRELARKAMEEGCPVEAREWFEAAEAATAASRAAFVQPSNTIIQGAQTPPGPTNCPHCGKPWSMCPGHSICEVTYPGTGGPTRTFAP